MIFADRREAGQRLSEALVSLRDSAVVVLGLPRGGVPVAVEVSRALNAPLDVIVVRKLGLPFQPELAMGAVAEGGVTVVDRGLMLSSNVSEDELEAAEAQQRQEVDTRVRRFCGERQRVSLEGRHAVIVDDGLATGATVAAACKVAIARGAAKITVAVPVCAGDAAIILDEFADEVVCLEQPSPFYAVGQNYADFAQTTDEEVIDLLRQRAAELSQGDRGEEHTDP